MKRRVLRAHANKRNLRLISAANALVPGAYNVLCDASFLRAVLAAYTHEHVPRPPRRHTHACGRNNNNNNNSEANVTATAPSVHVFAFLRQHVEEAFSVLDSHTAAGSAGGGNHASTSSRKPTQLHVRYLCLPTTPHALRRLVLQHNDKSTAAQRHAAWHLPHRTIDMRHVDKLLRGLEVLRRAHTSHDDSNNDSKALYHFDDSHRNEVKAIAELLHYCAALQRDDKQSSRNATAAASRPTTSSPLPPLTTTRYGSSSSNDDNNNDDNDKERDVATDATSSAEQQQQQAHQSLLSPSHASRLLSTTPNAHHLFVATQSHDVRRALPSHAAVLRLARQPTCVWVEQCGGSSSSNIADDDVSSTNVATAAAAAAAARSGHTRCHASQRAVASPLTSVVAAAPLQRARLSAADVAFMASLDTTTTTSTIRPLPSSPTTTSSSCADAGTATTTTVSQPRKRPRSSSVRSGKAHKTTAAAKATLHANPLSRKKKRKREVFRVDKRA